MRAPRVAVVGAIAVVLSALIIAPGGADDGSVGGAGVTAYPLYNRDVQMASERVILDGGRVRCEFAFRNASDRPTRVQVGFPEAAPEGGNPDATLHDLEAWLDGKRVAVVIKAAVPSPDHRLRASRQHIPRERTPRGLPPGIRVARWYTWWMDFKPRQTRVVTHTYRIAPSENTAGYWSYRYLLRTGALWKGGEIGEADVWFRAGRRETDMVGFPFAREMLLQPQAAFLGAEARDLKLVFIKPDGFHIGKGWIHWHWTKLKPREDIYVGYAGRDLPRKGAPSLPRLIDQRFPKTHFAALARTQEVIDAIVSGSWRSTPTVTTGDGWAYERVAEYERDFPDGYGLDLLLLTLGAQPAGYYAERRVAVDLLARLVRQFPHSPYVGAAHYWSAAALHHQGRYADALTHLRAALTSPPESTMSFTEKYNTLILAADCYEQTGDKEKARYYRSLAQLAHGRPDFVPWVGGG
jgi:tetratricopeptide (TPR) repeat protein